MVRIEEEWAKLPVVARVALIASVIGEVKSEDKRYGAASWEKVPENLRALLTPIFRPADTDASDRTVRAGWIGGKPVYRASQAGRCAHELFLWRTGAGDQFDPNARGNDPYRDKGELGAQEGNLHETWMIDTLRKEGYEITKAGGDQDELEVRYKRFVVRSHPDGLIRGLELGSAWRVLECKALNEERSSMWDSLRWGAFQNYATQMSLEMFLATKKYGVDVKGYFVVKNRNTGKMNRSLVEDYPVDPSAIINKFSAIEDLVEAGNSRPACPEEAEWWWCPFRGAGYCDALKRPNGDPVPQIDDPGFTALVEQFQGNKLKVKELEEEQKALRSLIMERMTVPALRIGEYFAKVGHIVKQGFDIPGAKDYIRNHGGDPDDFNKTSEYDQLRITGGKDDSSDPFETA